MKKYISAALAVSCLALSCGEDKEKVIERVKLVPSEREVITPIEGVESKSNLEMLAKSLKVDEVTENKPIKVIKFKGSVLLVLDKSIVDNKTPYLLLPNLSTQGVDVDPSSELGSYVFFEKVGNQVVLKQDISHVTLTPESGIERALTKFDVVYSESAEAYVFDLANDFKKIPVFGSKAYASDFEEKIELVDTVQSINLDHLIATRYQTNSDKGEFLISFSGSQQGAEKNEYVGANLYFKPVNLNSDYVPLLSPFDKQVAGSPVKYTRYFENPPVFSKELLENRYEIRRPRDKVKVYVTRFHPGKQIKFAISKNTPKDYVEAVAAGVTYWNKAIGEEKFVIVEAAEDAFAPSIDYNMVQWLYNTSGTYADWQSDPRTGEIQLSQTYISNGWAVSTRNRAEAFVKNYTGVAKLKEDHGPGCGAHNLDDYKNSLSVLLSETKDLTEEEADKVFLNFSRDIITRVVAHEIGHIIGLRHNFYGSKQASFKKIERDGTSTDHAYTWKDRFEIFKDYVVEGNGTLAGSKKYKDVQASSTVMDYDNHVERAFLGDFVSTNDKALPYDIANAKFLWGKLQDEENKTDFSKDENYSNYLNCTDFGSAFYPEVSNFYDCLKYDTGTLSSAQLFSTDLFDNQLKFILDFDSLETKVNEAEDEEAKGKAIDKHFASISKAISALELSEEKFFNLSLLFAKESEFIGSKAKELDVLVSRIQTTYEGDESIAALDVEKLDTILPYVLKSDKDAQVVEGALNNLSSQVTESVLDDALKNTINEKIDEVVGKYRVNYAQKYVDAFNSFEKYTDVSLAKQFIAEIQQQFDALNVLGLEIEESLTFSAKVNDQGNLIECSSDDEECQELGYPKFVGVQKESSVLTLFSRKPELQGSGYTTAQALEFSDINESFKSQLKAKLIENVKGLYGIQAEGSLDHPKLTSWLKKVLSVKEL